MKSTEIRNQFLSFFEEKTHSVVSSAPMVVKNDPTLMFTNAGMNQFKDYFLGNTVPKVKRICDTQKCLRVSGKHNDLEEVGYDTYHHTMFEMLGNWSFGDYFKKEAIEWAWELLTEVYKIDKDRLYVSVFEGSDEDGLKKDNEAFDIWSKLIDTNRIIDGSKKDNFWEMGEVGPCGPCSEIHVDIRSNEDRQKVDGKTLVNADHPEVIEVWNLVFMQFNRKMDGSLEALPQTHVDTGMGFERLCMVLQGVQSNYDTDIFQPIIKKIASLSNKKYGADEKDDIAMRVIADHLRAVAFSIADGQLPSNTGAGYVIRRILRRAVRYAFTFLDAKDPFMCHLVDELVENMGSQFKELSSQSDLIKKVIQEEEASFLKTLDKGIARFETIDLKDNEVSGKDAFELYDTFGFPIDLTQLLAQEKNCKVNIEAFNSLLELQKERSRKATSLETDDWEVLFEDEVEEFVGYDSTESKVKIVRYRKVKQKGDEFYHLVFNLTPFYPEGGGQVGDNGQLVNDSETIKILDTKKENNLIVHIVEALPSNLTSDFTAKVDVVKRKNSANNHTATHLLHETLREVLGDHVAQKGSLVNSDYLRFDFSHFSKVDSEDLKTIEGRVNSKIRANFSLEEFRNLPFTKAEEMGAMALFGEKYGDTVRVIKFGSSAELCGGIHVESTGEIGLFKILSESAVASGIRRIEAVSADKAVRFYEDKLGVLNQLQGILKTNDLLKSVSQLVEENQALNKKINQLNSEKAGDLLGDLMTKAEEINGVNLVSSEVDLDSKSIKNLAFKLTKENDNLLLVLASKADGKAMLTVAVSEQLSKNKDLHAGKIVKELAVEISGGGGGQAFFATAGGKDISGIPKALSKAKSFL
ncbi:alanine--tRNA ligase [Flavobacteriales bacterium]|jgi:alanyl-tRNA synthetase|nr:alanine--tRNA ligase [Flavobacteriales bacterium]